MRVQAHPADEGGCGWYRVRWVVAALREQGHDVEVATSFPQTMLYRDATGEHAIDVLDVDADVVVLQRPLKRLMFEIIAPLQRRGVAVVVEIDDDFHALPPGHICRRPGQWTPDHSPRWLRRACEEADLVTVTTPALAERYGAHGRVMVLPNMVPLTHFQPRALRSIDRPVTVGWTGSIQTHVGDLEATEGGVAAAVRETGARFHVIGTGAGVKVALGLDESPSTTGGWVPFDEYPAAYGGLEVAIVPLADNPFNEAKSDLKGLEALALGVPFIASPTGPYRELVRASHGGIIAEPGTWERWVRMLIEEPDARAWLVDQGRRYVAEHRTYDRQAWRWWEAWSHAAATAQNRRAA